MEFVESNNNNHKHKKTEHDTRDGFKIIYQVVVFRWANLKFVVFLLTPIGQVFVCTMISVDEP